MFTSNAKDKFGQPVRILERIKVDGSTRENLALLILSPSVSGPWNSNNSDIRNAVGGEAGEYREDGGKKKGAYTELHTKG